MGMKVVSIRLPDWMIDLIDRLVLKGVFISRAEIIRYGIRLVLRAYREELNRDIWEPIDFVRARLKKEKLEQEAEKLNGI